MPVIVLRQYRTPTFIGPRTLVFAMSYSGNTEETISMTRDTYAGRAGGHRLRRRRARTALAAEHGGVRIPCPSGLMPRATLGALIAPLFVVLFRLGLYPEAHASLVMAQEQLAHRREQCRPEVAAARTRRRLPARRIGRTIPLVYGGGALGAVPRHGAGSAT